MNEKGEKRAGPGRLDAECSADIGDEGPRPSSKSRYSERSDRLLATRSRFAYPSLPHRRGQHEDGVAVAHWGGCTVWACDCCFLTSWDSDDEPLAGFNIAVKNVESARHKPSTCSQASKWLSSPVATRPCPYLLPPTRHSPPIIAHCPTSDSATFCVNKPTP
jgi:hypothetical protein